MALWVTMLLTLLSVCQIAPGEEAVEEKKMGGWNPLDPESQQVQEVAKEAVDRFSMKANSPNYFRLVHVTSASAQVTNAIHYKIIATIGETKCSKSEHVDLKKCEMGKERKQCDFEVTYSLNSVKPQVKSRCR
ncbi:onchocystatin-like [Alosa sapidissima]|uniref:onchocystatin-like n=1 Tax=Alosa sapidissima TaxID=34773 RepID=UPI001C09F946|nr:onchocystatin-like [Alosa sapidissima]